MRHVVMFSGGVTSWAAAKRVALRHGTVNLTLLFADTRIEDEDLYRFLGDAAANVGGTLVRIADGRTPWEVFRDERFLGNHRIDPCSRILKRELLDSWLRDHCDPAETMIAYGFDWSEGHRLERMVRYPGPWTRWAPLLDPPYLTKSDLLALLRAEGIMPPRLYALGFSHNNCGGGCVKAGQAAWANLLRQLPDRYRWWEEKEEEFRRTIGKDVSMLTDRTGGQRRPLTLRDFRERIETGGSYDLADWGSCGCWVVAEGTVARAPEGVKE